VRNPSDLPLAVSAVGFGAMQNGVNEDGSGRLFVEADAVVADAEAEFAGVALQLSRCT